MFLISDASEQDGLWESATKCAPAGEAISELVSVAQQAIAAAGGLRAPDCPATCSSGMPNSSASLPCRGQLSRVAFLVAGIRRDPSHGNNSGGQFPDRGLGPQGESACRDHLSIAGMLICQPSGLANRHPASTRHAPDRLQQPACHGKDRHAGRAYGAAADHRRGQHTCRAGLIRRAISLRTAETT